MALGKPPGPQLPACQGHPARERSAGLAVWRVSWGGKANFCPDCTTKGHDNFFFFLGKLKENLEL